MEWLTFGRSLWRCRCAFLAEMQTAKSALLIGDGDGRFAARLLEINRGVKIDAVDASCAMLDVLAQSTRANSDRVCTHCADVRAWEPPAKTFDLIVTHFSLDCLATEEVAELARSIRSLVTPSARWIVSEFAIPQGWRGWMFARPLIAILYFAFRLLTGLRIRRLPEHRKVLANAGFVLEQQRSCLGGLLTSEIWTAQ
jgi:SAM-dependent methyltransferase